MEFEKEEWFCEDCENPIDERRLEAIPHAKLCLECKSNNENFRR